MLVDTQRCFVEICFRREPPEEALDRLGGQRDRWLLYRHMVRTRMQGMIANALKRTVAALGEDAWNDWYARWLDEAPPRTRYIREIVPELVAFARPRWRQDPAVPAFVPELADMEATRFELGYLDAPIPEAGEIAFEKTPVLSPFVRLLRVEHAVHRVRADDVEPPPKEPTTLCIYRTADDRTGVLPLDDFAATLLASFQHPDGADITTLVKRAAAHHSLPIDEPLVRRVGTLLADLLQRTILLGAI